MVRIIQRIVLSLLVTVATLGAFEGVLRLTQPDLEEVVSPLVYQRNSGDAFTRGPVRGTRQYVSGRRRIATDKVPGKRIMVFGASAAYGEMFSPFTAFPGVTERLLRTSTEEPIEVLNLAHGGMGSRQVGEMVFRVLEHGGADLIVLYTGNNEYHELRALKARSDRYDAKAELMRRRLSQAYLYRQLREWFVPTEDALLPPEGEEWLPVGRMDVTVDQNDRDLGIILYREHLRDIILAAEARGVPVLLTTVASNLRNHLDNGTPGRPSAAEQTTLRELEGMASQTPPSEFLDAVANQIPANMTESGFHRLGQLFLRAKLPKEAKEAFENKELVALRPMTSNRSLRTTVLQLGSQYGVPVCDLAERMNASSPDGIAGNDVFIDHCHPNALGHQRLGEALAECIANNDLLKIGSQQLNLSLPAKNTFRIDHYDGHRPIPGIPQPVSTHAPGSPEASAFKGHQFFVQDRFDQALQQYNRAAELGASPAAIQHSIGLTHLYRGDLQAAQSAMRKAVEAGNEDSKKVLLTIGG